MKFTVLSHASMLVETDEVRLLIDPWLVGSCYWRSWWNYPKPSRLAFSSDITHIYLTHMHWDHFHGPSLAKLPKTATMLLPQAHFPRMQKDAADCGFPKTHELPHGKTVALSPRLRVTSYQYGLFMDSILVIDDGETVLVDMNDCKITGWPLRQLCARHPKVDFLFRSHSSACAYPYCVDAEDRKDLRYRNNDDYLQQFVSAATIMKARYAVPFASNHCFLHRETWRFNDTAVSPLDVQSYFREQRPPQSQCVVMVPGDSWKKEEGFQLQPHDFFTNREKHLAEYAAEVAPVLEKQYKREALARVTFSQFEKYFTEVIGAIPRLSRVVFKPIVVFSVKTNANTHWVLDFNQRRVYESAQLPNNWSVRVEVHPAVLRDCIQKRMFGVFTPSKRLAIHLKRGKVRDMLTFFQILNLHEYGYLPPRKMLSRRFLSTWLRRWREAAQFALSLLVFVRDRNDDDLSALIPTISLHPVAPRKQRAAA